MTAIVYHKGQLIADDVHLALTCPIRRLRHKKIFVSKDKTFAYGFASTTLNDSIRPMVEEWVRKCIEQLSVSTSDSIDVSEIDPSFSLNIEYGYAMTKHEVFFFRQDKGKGIVRRTTGITQGCGSGGALCAALLITGSSIEKAMKQTNAIDPVGTGDTPTIIKASSLKPFIIRG